MQHAAEIVLVEVPSPPEELWRARIEARAAAEAHLEGRHKPGWDQLQTLITGCALLVQLNLAYMLAGVMVIHCMT